MTDAVNSRWKLSQISRLYSFIFTRQP
jgi:hypothetical protein